MQRFAKRSFYATSIPSYFHPRYYIYQKEHESSAKNKLEAKVEHLDSQLQEQEERLEKMETDHRERLEELEVHYKVE